MLALLMVGLIGLADYYTGWELSLFVFYAVPIFLIVWRGRRTEAYALALLCTVVWLAANLPFHPYQTWWGFPSAAACRLIYFVTVVIGGDALRAIRASDRARIAALERANVLEREILRVSEREQRRIGQDLHDGLCQYLAAVGCAARSLADDLGRKNAPESAEAREIETLLKEAVVQTRDLAAGIFPAKIGELGLSAALRSLAVTTQKLASVAIEFVERDSPHVDDPEAAMHLFRIAQEALNNAIRHGGAKSIQLSLEMIGRDQVRLMVKDDGRGLPSNISQREGMGFRTMHYRAVLLGAALEIRNGDGGGCVLSCVMKSDATPSMKELE